MNIANIVPWPLFTVYLVLVTALPVAAGTLTIGNAAPRSAEITIDTTSWRGGNTIFGGLSDGSLPAPKLQRERPRFGVDFVNARGDSMLRLDANGCVFVRDGFVERDPNARALTAFVSWLGFYFKNNRAPDPGRYVRVHPGAGYPPDKLGLAGSIIFEQNHASMFQIDADGGPAVVGTFRMRDNGVWRTVENAQVYGAFLLWLDTVMPPAKLGPHGRALVDDYRKGGGSAGGGGCMAISGGAGSVTLTIDGIAAAGQQLGIDDVQLNP